MEFGFLTQGYVPAHVRGDPAAEHRVLMEDFELCLAAERAGFKYVWISEHHFLDEYSHISSSDVFLGALSRTTTRAHLGSGIFNPLPKVNHPAVVAERVAMLDHLTEGRFEFGTGRGAGSLEVTGFHEELPRHDVGETRAIWEETIGEFAKMWLQDEYPGFRGKYWSMPPRRVLPKPFAKPHPPLWYAAGNPSSYEMAARKGLGVLGFSLDRLEVTEKAVASYKRAVREAEPVGAFVNDNLLVSIAVVYVAEDRAAARREALESGVHYYTSQVYRYHDTFLRPKSIPAWPDVLPAFTEETLDYMIDVGSAVIGDPEDALAQVRRWEATGADQFLLLRGPKSKEQTLETLRVMGEHVIPKVDRDPVHRTTRFREAACRPG